MTDFTDPTVLDLPEIKYYSIEPPEDTAEVTLFSGLFRSRFYLSMTDKNQDKFTDTFKQELSSYIDSHLASAIDGASVDCQELRNGDFVQTVRTFQETFLTSLMSQISDIPRLINFYIELNKNVYSDLKTVEYVVSFSQEMGYDYTSFNAYTAEIRVERKSAYRTSNWTSPPKHLFERNFEIYHKKFGFARS